MTDKKNSLEVTEENAHEYALIEFLINLNDDPSKMPRLALENDYLTLRDAWKREYITAEQFRRKENNLKAAKQNPKGFLKDIGLKDLNKKILIRLAMLRYNGVPDYPSIDCGEYSTRIPFTRKDMAEKLSWKIDPPSGHYVESLRSHLIDVLEEELTLKHKTPKRLSRDEGTEEGYALGTFLSEANIYELIADLN